MIKESDKRKQRLLELIATRYGGSQSSFAEATGMTLSQIGQWLGGHRNMNEKTARKIESLCGLPRGWMDDRVFLLNPMEQQLLEMYRAIPEDFKDWLLQDANKYLNWDSDRSGPDNPFPGKSPPKLPGKKK